MNVQLKLVKLSYEEFHYVNVEFIIGVNITFFSWNSENSKHSLIQELNSDWINELFFKTAKFNNRSVYLVRKEIISEGLNW